MRIKPSRINLRISDTDVVDIAFLLMYKDLGKRKSMSGFVREILETVIHNNPEYLQAAQEVRFNQLKKHSKVLYPSVDVKKSPKVNNTSAKETKVEFETENEEKVKDATEVASTDSTDDDENLFTLSGF